MKRWRKYALCLICALCMATLAGCGNGSGGKDTGRKENTVQENKQDDAAAGDKESGGSDGDNEAAGTDQNKNNGINGGTGNGIIAGKNAADDGRTGINATDNEREDGIIEDDADGDAIDGKDKADDLKNDNSADVLDGGAIVGTDENNTEKSFVNSVTDQDNTENDGIFDNENGDRGDDDDDGKESRDNDDTDSKKKNSNGKNSDDSDNGSADQNSGTLGNAADNLLDGVGDAGKDVIDGVGDAGKNVIDGIEGAGDALTGNETDAR